MSSVSPASSSGWPAPDFESLSQTMSQSVVLTVAHGLGAKPSFWTATMRCTTADDGYSIGDEIRYNTAADGADGHTFSADATNLVASQATSPAREANKSSTAMSAPLVSSWVWDLRAWK